LLQALAAKLSIPYVETSAKNSSNVEQAFAQMATSIKEKAKKELTLAQ
jgi:hypothetical protein